jgi:Zn-dependent M28 family amino/carboxypeptidase
MGSRYFVSHPTVELSSIAAVLNGDMMGRNAPDSAALLGATEPHLNSSDLVAITLAANKSIANFKVDTSWMLQIIQRIGRSDHLPMLKLMYQQYFTTLLHLTTIPLSIAQIKLTM